MAAILPFPVSESLVGWLLLWWLGMATGELLTCFYSTHSALRREFAWERKAVGKLLMVFIIFVAMFLDWLLYQLSGALPGEFHTALGVVALPITTGSLVWLNVAEGARIVVNIGHTEGRDSIPPVVRWVLVQMKRMDRERFPEKGHHEFERWTDDLTDAQIRALLLKGGIIDQQGRHIRTPPREPMPKDGTNDAH